MVLGFFRFIANDGFYWIAIVVALAGIALSDNSIKSAIFAFNYDNSYELVYFDIQGKAQQIRYVFDYLGVDYVDRRLNYDEWLQIKAA